MDRHRLLPRLPLIASGSVDPFRRRLSKVAILPSHLIDNQQPLWFLGNLQELANPEQDCTAQFAEYHHCKRHQ